VPGRRSCHEARQQLVRVTPIERIGGVAAAGATAGGLILAGLLVPSAIDHITGSDAYGTRKVLVAARHATEVRVGYLALVVALLCIAPATRRVLLFAPGRGAALVNVGWRVIAVGAAAGAVGNAFAPLIVPSAAPYDPAVMGAFIHHHADRGLAPGGHDPLVGHRGARSVARRDGTLAVGPASGCRRVGSRRCAGLAAHAADTRRLHQWSRRTIDARRAAPTKWGRCDEEPVAARSGHDAYLGRSYEHRLTGLAVTGAALTRALVGTAVAPPCRSSSAVRRFAPFTAPQ
jgi:hypothetical protein